MTDAEIMKALEFCVMPLRERKCESCAYYKQRDCVEKSAIDAVALIQRQQKQFETLKKAFRAEFEEKMELGIDDCINWADWLDSIAEEVKEGKYDDR